LLGRRGCHLCDEAETVLRSVLPEYGARLAKLDVDQDEEMRRLYGEEIPVVLINGRKAFKHRVDPGRLRRKLGSPQRRVV
ncbi:MAG TPA: glutaredoxin family protein, partial [Candidatus Polarisedimenticolia bacterium]|nr:glutaredoxin family protein [Candidatus Polarisedimenticolia bacterium]